MRCWNQASPAEISNAKHCAKLGCARSARDAFSIEQRFLVLANVALTPGSVAVAVAVAIAVAILPAEIAVETVFVCTCTLGVGVCPEPI